MSAALQFSSSSTSLNDICDHAYFMIQPEPVFDLLVELSLSRIEQNVYWLHFNQAFRRQRHNDQRGWVSHLTVPLVAERLQVTERSIKLAHKRLAEHGLIRRHRSRTMYCVDNEPPAKTEILNPARLQEIAAGYPARQKQSPLPALDEKETDLKHSSQTDVDNETAQHEAPSSGEGRETANNSSNKENVLAQLPDEVRIMVDLRQSPTLIRGKIKSHLATGGITEAFAIQAIELLCPEPRATSHRKTQEALNKHQPTPSGPTKVTDIEARLSRATEGRSDEIGGTATEALVSDRLNRACTQLLQQGQPISKACKEGWRKEVLFCISVGHYRDMPTKKAVNICISLIKQGRWTTPSGMTK